MMESAHTKTPHMPSVLRPLSFFLFKKKNTYIFDHLKLRKLHITSLVFLGQIFVLVFSKCLPISLQSAVASTGTDLMQHGIPSATHSI